jgi:hypothetical protein
MTAVGEEQVEGVGMVEEEVEEEVGVEIEGVEVEEEEEEGEEGEAIEVDGGEEAQGGASEATGAEENKIHCPTFNLAQIQPALLPSQTRGLFLSC